jgi:serine/threonine protein kinase
VNPDHDHSEEPLPGYKLIEKIGAGGYGEVWRVEAPGGLDKAMKFVFGTEHEKRATHELKSLKRIKELRHPFLLSLERIEIVQGRLIVVTELAEGSLKDRFDAYREKGEAGIPRTELLGYLRDAADALDYMFDAHALQHLDIKPENLLIVGGHVKVADFGLVKDVQQSQASIVGGMTPLYSAPEVFRGQPSPRSDQYSLAILYQEMLTGMLPFSGVTAAELTLQHLNDEPGLSPLSGADRYIAARALSKDPNHRYASCREFVESLIQSDSSRAGATAPGESRPGARCSVAVPSSERPNHATEVFDDDAAWNQVDEPMLIDLPDQQQVEVRELPPPEFTPSEFQPASTLFLGVGGAGGRVLGHLKRQLNERFNGMSRIPAVRMLLLDTDPKAVMESTHDPQRGLTAEETLALPLRRPQHYRENSARLLKWLSRRWLYNIPKSMRTEGLRPLGRLALVDHARQACQRIRQTIASSIDDVSLAESRDALGLPLAEGACRVYLVASTAGGTGSGMVLDLGYAVRAALKKLDVENAEIVAILMHSTSRDPRHSDLARVNTFSWLNEYQHFLLPHAVYPGDESCGLPAHEAGVKPFDHTYLLQLGEGLSDDDFDQATASVADYLHLDALSPSGTFFAACRQSTDNQPLPAGGAPQLRTFGLQRVGAAPSELSESFVDEVSRIVLKGWLGTDTPFETGVDQLVGKIRLNTTALAAQSREMLEASLGCDERSFLDRWLADRLPSGAEPSGTGALAAVDQLFRKSDEGHDRGGASLMVVRQTLSAIVQPLNDRLREQAGNWARGRVDVAGLRLAGARRAADELIAHCQETLTEAKSLAKQVASRLVEIHRAAADESAAQDEPPVAVDENPVLTYFRLRLDHCAMIAAEHIATSIVADLKADADALNQLGRDVMEMAGRVNGNADQWLSLSSDDSRGRAASHLHAQLAEIATRVDEQVQTQCIDQQGGLLAAIAAGGRTRAQLFSTLKECSHQAIQRSLSEVDVLAQVIGDADGASLAERIREVSPELLQYGGSRRVLAVLPKSAAEANSIAQIQASLGGKISLVPGCDNSLVLCVEGQDLVLPEVAVNVVQRRRDYVEFAERVHSRSDIQWTKLTDLIDQSAIKDKVSDQRPAAVTQALGHATQLTGTDFRPV